MPSAPPWFLAPLEARHGITLPGNFVATVDQAVEAELAPITGVRETLLRVPAAGMKTVVFVDVSHIVPDPVV
ncbi:MAG: hypothetical protein VB125_02910 [Burkholderia sp.]